MIIHRLHLHGEELAEIELVVPELFGMIRVRCTSCHSDVETELKVEILQFEELTEMFRFMALMKITANCPSCGEIVFNAEGHVEWEGEWDYSEKVNPRDLERAQMAPEFLVGGKYGPTP
jgi:endogenous inhibitor of DNA gyrase (YacG/DUF329 family)